MVNLRVYVMKATDAFLTHAIGSGDSRARATSYYMDLLIIIP